MPLLTSLLESASVGVPDSVGQAYNNMNKTGSWVISGINEYKKWTDNNFANIRRYLDAYFNFKRDPTKAIWMVDMLTRKNPVEPPPHMGAEDWNFLRSLLNKAMGKGKSEQKPWCLDPEKSRINPENIIRANSYQNYRNSKDFTLAYGSLYGGPFSGSVAYSDEANSEIYSVSSFETTTGIRTGYRNWYGFEPGSDHLWVVQLYPYKGPGTGNVPGPDLRTVSPTQKTYTPDLPSYYLPEILFSGHADMNKGITDDQNPKWREFSFSDDLPCLSYNLQYGSMQSKQVGLFNGSSFNMPMGFSYNLNFGMDILDDRTDSFRKYMNSYINATYSESKGAIARYDQSAFLIRLTILESEFKVKHEFRLIGVPINYTPQYDGNSSPDLNTVHIDFSIVGQVLPTIKQNYNSQRDQQNDVSRILENWTQITISPNNLV